MIYAFCGLIIGIVMGLTGAGGALVAIPLFIQFLAMTLKDASVYSLLAVVIASLFNFFAQKHFTNYKVALSIVIYSAIGSFISAPIKKFVPDIIIAALLTFVSLYALYSVWFSIPRIKNFDEEAKQPIILTLFIGLALGFLTTITGLGGGVLMMPIFLKFYDFDQPRAVATSLLAVSLSSLISLLIQIKDGFTFPLDKNLLFLLMGIILSAFIIKKLTTLLTSKMINKIRKIIFSLVVILAISKIL